MDEIVTILPRAYPSRAKLAAASFLAGYSGNTLTSYVKDLEIFFNWCEMYSLDPLEATRAHIELFSRYLTNERRNKPASVHRRLTTIRCFYRMCVYDDVIMRSPADHVKLPKIFLDEMRTLGIERHEMATMIAYSKSTTPSEHALLSLMGLMGLRVSEACSLLIEDTQGFNRGHRTISYIGKGNKPAIDPVSVPVARALDAATGDRAQGRLLLRPDGISMDRRHAARVVARIARKVGIETKVTPHMFRHGYVTNGLDAGIDVRLMQVGARHADPRTTIRYDRNRRNFDQHPNYIVASYIAGSGMMP